MTNTSDMLSIDLPKLIIPLHDILPRAISLVFINNDWRLIDWRVLLWFSYVRLRLINVNSNLLLLFCWCHLMGGRSTTTESWRGLDWYDVWTLTHVQRRGLEGSVVDIPPCANLGLLRLRVRGCMLILVYIVFIVWLKVLSFVIFLS